MNYSDIHTFLTIASNSSLSKAAELLYISQPTLSHRLHNLEEELGVSLVVRQQGVRSIQLTEAGRRFVPIARKWETLWEETENLKYHKPQISLHIASVDSLNLYFMPRACLRFLSRYENRRLNLLTMHSDDAYRAVENHEAELALVTNPHFFKKVQTIPLFREPMTLLCAQDAPYQDGLLPSELSTRNEIYIPWSNSFLMWHDYWFESRSDTRSSLDNMFLLKSLLQLPDAWAIVPATLSHVLLETKELRSVTLQDAPQMRQCFAIMDNQNRENQAANDFLDILLEVAEEFPEITVAEEKHRFT